MNRTYYTLRAPRKAEGCIYPEKVYPKEFDSYEEAYNEMCQIYFAQTMMGKAKEDPERYGIWRTDITEWGGKTNSMTQPVWG